MSTGGRRGGVRQRRILVFGEDLNDTQALASLLVALCPEWAGKVKALRQPPVLIRDAKVKDVPGRADRLIGLIRAEAEEAEVVCVFAHEDCDDYEPAHEPVAHKIEGALASAGVPVHAVVPAWEMESWWFLWPEALKAYRPSWADADQYVGKNVGKIKDAKEALKAALKPKGRAGQSARPYRESDSPGIAKKVADLGLAANPRGTSASFERFSRSVAQSCGAAAP